MSEQEAKELAALVKRTARVYRDLTKDQYIIKCVELENDNRTLRLQNEMLSAELAKTEYMLRAERASAANIGFGTLVKRWWRGKK